MPASSSRVLGVAVLLAMLPHSTEAQGRDSSATSRLHLSDVVAQALHGAPQLLSAQQGVVAAGGALDAARAPFDAQLRSAAQQAREQSYPLASGGIAEQSVSTINTQYSVSLVRLLRSGIAVTPSLSVARSGLASAQSAPGRASAMLTVDLPLLRGRGGGLATASERSAERTLVASEHELRQSAAECVLSAVLSYWNYVAAAARLEVYRGSELRAARLVEETRALVNAEERAAAEMDQVRTNLALKRSTRIGAEQAIVDARAALARASGVSSQAARSLAMPGTPFPAPSSDAGDRGPLDASMFAAALARRDDRAAARLRTEAASLLQKAAQQEERPGMHLRIGAGYSGIAIGERLGSYLAPIYQNVPGLNSTFQITYDIPLRNSGARGLAIQLEAATRQNELAMQMTERDIESGVVVADEAYRHAVAELGSAQEAVALAQRAVENEKTKFTLGVSTQVDVILAQDALTNALVGEIGGRLRYATALVRLRYETGTLVSRDGGALSVDVEALLNDVSAAR